MLLVYRENYWNSAAAKAAYIDFLTQMFNLDLIRWDQSGYWDSNYRPFSYFSDDRLVSNVCVYSLDMVVLGKRCRAAQISAVGTVTDFRRQGLGQELTQRALVWARDRHDFFFLFADEDAFGFYKSNGFRQALEYTPRIAVSGASPVPGAVALDMQDEHHRALAHDLAVRRDSVSDRLGVLNDKLFMFWCLYRREFRILHIPQLDTLVLCRRDGDVLTISDIVSPKVPMFADIYPFISDPRDRFVKFMFMSDKLGLKEVELIETNDHGLHLLGDFPPEGTSFIFPQTCHA
jgi:ribosomal protein S18 acetylase RimI-like enzyme